MSYLRSEGKLGQLSDDIDRRSGEGPRSTAAALQLQLPQQPAAAAAAAAKAAKAATAAREITIHARLAA